MNKVYPTRELVSAWLVEANPDRTLSGIKNIIGILVKHSDGDLFYSILDDCFFRILPSKQGLIYNSDIYSNKLFVEIYDNVFVKPIGIELYEKTQIDLITKEDIVKYRLFITGHYDDFDYVDDLDMDTNVDYEESLMLDKCIIDSELEYREKQGRLITYSEDCIYGPRILKKIKI